MVIHQSVIIWLAMTAVMALLNLNAIIEINTQQKK